MRGTIALIISVIILFCPLLNLVAQEKDAEILKLGKEAISHYEQNELDKAVLKFNQWLLARPTDQQALKLRQMAGIELMMQMLMRGGEMSRIARAILLYAERAPIRQETDKENIKKLVESAATGNLYQRNESIALLESQVGERAVPYMLPYLANQTKDTERVNIILTVTKMGRTVVVPLIEALNTSDQFLKQQLAIVLGHIGDKRAIADLKAVLEDPKVREEVKKYTKLAIKQIVKKPAIALPPAKELYYQKAFAYYKDDPNYKPILSFNWLQWKWQEDELVYQEIPAFAYNEIMAEQACYRAIKIDADFKKAWALLVKVYYAQFTEIKAVEQASKEKGLNLPEQELKKFLKEKPFANKAKDLAAAVGPNILYMALKSALTRQENRPEVTVKILEDIGNQARGRGDLPRALLTALRNKDKRIRYAAAEAIGKMNPTRAFTESRRVIKVLEQAVAEWDSRLVLIIDDDDASRNKMVDIIRGMNLLGFGVENGLEGVKRAKSFPPEDLIIVSSKLQDLATAYLINSIREDYRTRDIPIIVLASKEEKEKITTLYQKVPQIKGILVKPLVENEVKSLVKKSIDESKSDYKSKARDIARRAVEVLANIYPRSPLFVHLMEARDALGEVLLTRHDSIRLPAIKALGNLGDKKALPALMELLVDKEASLEIRLQVVWTLGQIYNRTKIKVSKEDVERIVSILKEKPTKEMEENPQLKEKLAQLQRKVYYLLGQANIEPEQRRQIFNTYRVHQTIKVVEKVEEKKPKAEEKKPEVKKPEKKEKTEEEIWEEKKTDEKIEEAKGDDDDGDDDDDDDDGDWGDDDDDDGF